MEALAAVALAGNVIQFVDVAKNIYRDGRSLYKDGQAKDIGEMKVAAQSIADFSKKLDSDAKTPHPTTKDEEDLKMLADECTKLADEIVRDIDGHFTSTKGRVFQAMKGAFLSKDAKAKHNEKIVRLEKIQKSLESQTLASIKITQRRNAATISAFKQQNEATGANIQDRLGSLEKSLAHATDTILGSVAKITKDEIEVIGETIAATNSQSTMYKRMFTVLRSLRYLGMMDRKEHISQAHSQTLSWIFQKQPEFTHWLEHGDDIFWISGVPGSGKSTLMKLLMDESEPDTRKHLERWAGGSKLIVAGFYFWANGTPEQKSKEGFLRAVLFQILRQCPEIIAEVLSPDILLHVDEDTEKYSWNLSDLSKTLSETFKVRSEAKFCLFIDGLDEYEDASRFSGRTRSTDHVKGDNISDSVIDIINTIQSLSSNANVKLCVSSRPWLPFEAAFGKAPDKRLDVEKFNEEDIRKYVVETMAKDISGYAREEDWTTFDEMAETIISESRGVFLWVALVVKSLIKGIKSRDNATELRQRLEETPRDLNDFFQRMLDLTEERYQKDAMQMISIALFAEECEHRAYPLALYCCVGFTDPEFGLTETPGSITANEEFDVYEQALDRFRTRCPDLLNVRKEPSQFEDGLYSGRTMVQFVHRSAVEYLKSAQAQSIMTRKGNIMLHPATYLANALLSIYRAGSSKPTVYKDDRALVSIRIWVEWIFFAHGGQQRDLQRRLLSGYFQTLSTRPKKLGSSNFYSETLETESEFYEIRRYLYDLPESLWYAEEAFPSGSFLSHQKSLTEMLLWSYAHLPKIIGHPKLWHWALQRGALPNSKCVGPGHESNDFMEELKKRFSLKDGGQFKESALKHLEDTAWMFWVGILNAMPYWSFISPDLAQTIDDVGHVVVKTRLFLACNADPFKYDYSYSYFENPFKFDDFADVFTSAFREPEAKSLITLLEQKRAEHGAREAESNDAHESPSTEEVKPRSGIDTTRLDKSSNSWNPLRWLSRRRETAS